MNTGGVWWRLRGRSRYFSWVLPVLFVSVCPGSAGAGLITGSYELTWDQDVEKTAVETTNIRKFKQNLELKYKGFLSPIVENEVTFKVEQEVNSNAADTTRFLPTLDLGFKGKFWELTSGAKRTHENSDEPGKNPKVTDSYFVEFFYLAPRSAPDLKAKYTLDTDFEEGATDTVKQEVTLSSEYKPTDWLNLKGDYNRILNDDNLNVDADTEDEKIGGTIALRHFFSDKIKVNSEYDLETTRGATLLDAGGAVNQKEDQTHTWKNAASFRPFAATDIDGTYDFDIKQNMVNGEHTLTKNAKGTVRQKVSFFDLRGEFNRVITEARHTADDNEKTEDTWTADASVKYSKHLDFTIKYQKKDTVEIHLDPSRNTGSGTRNWTGTWNGELTPFWKASVSYDRTDTLEREVLTTVDTKYSYKSTFDFKAIFLTIDPLYEITLKEDLQTVPATDTETRDFQFKIAWKIFPTMNTEAMIDHTYGRKTDSGAANIQRTDDTTINLNWKKPAPGWTVSFDVTRNATDTSEDDLPPDITSSFGFKVDYKKDWLAMNTSYKYDKKSLTGDVETFDMKVGWAAPKWELSLTYKFDKTYSEEIDEGYSIGLTFKYNL